MLLDIYYQGLNDFNVFVEDEDKEYEYETIFKRLFGDKYCIFTIFPCGGKPKVEKYFNEFGEEDNGVKNFYIVDGDFDRYIDRELINNPCFIYLKTYNIESYFLDEESCVQYIKGKFKKLDKETRDKVNFPHWKTTIVEQATKLFKCYCFIKKHYPATETTSRSPCEFIDFETGFERTDGAYQKYWETVVLKLDSKPEGKIKVIIKEYEKINGSDYFNLICGKFLFDSLYFYLRAIVGSKFSKDDLRWHLINHFDVSKLDYVKEKITSLLIA
jgi:hypothetical protein